MLKGISPLLSPELLATLAAMGHGDTIVLADAHFPGETMGQRVIRADGLRIAPLLDAILPLLELDAYIDAPIRMMAPVEGDQLDPTVEQAYREAIDRHAPQTPPIGRVERFAFYGETAKYGNVILTKGVTPA
jgi:L-fucose mutarotase